MSRVRQKESWYVYNTRIVRLDEWQRDDEGTVVVSRITDLVTGESERVQLYLLEDDVEVSLQQLVDQLLSGLS